MAPHTRLLPGNATKPMLAAAEANDPFARLAGAYDSITYRYRNPSPDIMPFVVWQLGLGELSPFLPNLYSLVPQGVQWQRVRGTPKALELGLGWLGYQQTLHEDPVRRRKWNRFQLELDRVRDADLPDLRGINGIADLSPPARSVFYRGFKGYDVRACETSRSRLSATMLSSHSGVRIETGKAKWSFGRPFNGDALLGQTELTAIGEWTPAVSESELWVNANYLWADADFPWAVPAAISRRNTIANGLAARTALVRFSAAGGAIIGYRRAIVRPARPDPAGEYLVGSQRWKAYPSDPLAVVVQARTGFGDGNGQTAATMSVLFNPTIAVGVPAGQAWLTPGQVSGGYAVATTNVSITFGLTVRELCRFTLRFS